MTLSAVMNMTTTKIILALARVWRTPARHGDVPNVYVKAEKEDDLEIFLQFPQGMVMEGNRFKVADQGDRGQVALRLKKILYGLKQAGRLWAELLHKTLVELGFVQCYTDSCLYYKRSNSEITIVGVYVDDLLVTGTKMTLVDSSFVLEVKDLGVVTKFLGMGIKHDEDKGYIIEQEQCIRELLVTTRLELANLVRTPIGEDQGSESKGNLLPGGSGGTVEQPTIATFQSLIRSLL